MKHRIVKSSQFWDACTAMALEHEIKHLQERNEKQQILLDGNKAKLDDMLQRLKSFSDLPPWNENNGGVKDG